MNNAESFLRQTTGNLFKTMVKLMGNWLILHNQYLRPTRKLKVWIRKVLHRFSSRKLQILEKVPAGLLTCPDLRSLPIRNCRTVVYFLWSFDPSADGPGFTAAGTVPGFNGVPFSPQTKNDLQHQNITKILNKSELVW